MGPDWNKGMGKVFIAVAIIGGILVLAVGVGIGLLI